jgi:hypothetical protein
MKILHNPSASEQSFKQFLFHNKRNKIILFMAVAAIVIQFAIFKYLYPFASYIHGDSFSYINAADQNLTINTYLIGYSKFLRLISIFAKPDVVLVALQYLLIHCSMLFLLFTIFYFYKLRQSIQSILLCFMVFNPLFLHLGNMVSSDGIFLALSCIWYALLLWIIYRPSNKIIIWHAVILVVAFTVRYNALIYPFIAVIAFSISKLPLTKKLAGVGLGIAFCGIFVGFTMLQYKKVTGYWQYSPFSGWQLANNAMYMYKHIDSSDRKPVPPKFKALDDSIWNFLSLHRRLNATTLDPQFSEASTVYMWSPGMPLMNYRNALFKKANDTAASEFKKWATMGPLYKAYGSYMIQQYPWQYIWYFARYNARKYYAPPVEFLQNYNSGNKWVTPQAARWFGYKNFYVNVRMGNKKTWILDFYPILSGILNVIMLFGLLYYVILKGWKYNADFNKSVILTAAVWIINASFTIFASSAALRFQSFPVLLTTIFVLLLVDWMLQLIVMLQLELKKQKILGEELAIEAIG